MATDSNGTRISPNGTWINLSILIMVVAGAISLTTFLVGYQKDLTASVGLLEQLVDRVGGVEVAVRDLQFMTADRWTGTDTKLYVSAVEKAVAIYITSLERLNPSLVMPPPLELPPPVRARIDDH